MAAGTEVRWHVADRMRADLVAYAAPNLAGKRTAAQVFPRSRKGTLLAEEIRSLVIRAPHGVRVVLCTNATDDWERWPWRCVRMVPGTTVPSQRGEVGLPGVFLPDLDLLDAFGAKRTAPDPQSSYPLVERLADGAGWTFGRAGLPSLKGHVRMIRIEPDVSVPADVPVPADGAVAVEGPEARVAERILALAERRLPADALAELQAIVREVLADGAPRRDDEG